MFRYIMVRRAIKNLIYKNVIYFPKRTHINTSKKQCLWLTNNIFLKDNFDTISVIHTQSILSPIGSNKITMHY